MMKKLTNLYNDNYSENVGKAFIAPAGTMHSVRSDTDIYVCAFLVPVIDER